MGAHTVHACVCVCAVLVHLGTKVQIQCRVVCSCLVCVQWSSCCWTNCSCVGFILSADLSSHTIVKSQAAFLNGYNMDGDDFLCVSQALKSGNSHFACGGVCLCLCAYSCSGSIAICLQTQASSQCP